MDKSQRHYAKWGSQSQQITDSMMPFLCHSEKGINTIIYIRIPFIWHSEKRQTIGSKNRSVVTGSSGEAGSDYKGSAREKSLGMSELFCILFMWAKSFLSNFSCFQLMSLKKCWQFHYSICELREPFFKSVNCLRKPYLINKEFAFILIAWKF